MAIDVSGAKESGNSGGLIRSLGGLVGGAFGDYLGGPAAGKLGNMLGSRLNPGETQNPTSVPDSDSPMQRRLAQLNQGGQYGG
jgi:hypothetical protein